MHPWKILMKSKIKKLCLCIKYYIIVNYNHGDTNVCQYVVKVLEV